MEENNKQMPSIFGKWWVPVRKWFYPAWLVYELSLRFYGYSLGVQNYFMNHYDYLSSFLGHSGTSIITAFCVAATFILCFLFLTLPAGYVLYYFFKQENVTATRFEPKLKKYF